ncbi:DUF697 domain-containing protein, partial [Candidatus Magnetaquicoccus inordinatus]|uniref:DUF697 domain-containing protein n=1 Tax=Candidatus Magnetaquicoccus inordinatus TaxID=2496818 RepID=UPI00102C91AB
MRFTHPWIASPELATVPAPSCRNSQPSTPMGETAGSRGKQRVEPDIFTDAPQKEENAPLRSSSATATAIQPKSHKQHLRGWLTVLTFMVVSMLTGSSVHFLVQMWQWQPLVGFLFAVLFSAVVGTLLTVVWREWRQWRQLRTVAEWQMRAEQLLDQESYGQAYSLLRRLLHFYRQRSDLRLGLESFQRLVDDDMEDAEQVVLFSEEVLTLIDKQAYQTVVRHASGTAMLSAVSPMLWLDGLLFLWRSLSLLQEIAALY